MIEFERFTLANGLRVLVHIDTSTPMVAMNIVYDVGARDEKADKTGFAHLFEHLMFGGSKNIPDFDKPLQMAGGQSNAFTSNDITNYYDTLPLQNLETAFWLESDRMNELAFTPKSLEVQRNVVIEEFKQRYLNQPYGDIWLLLRPLAYMVHPYQWATIGKEISHIENATMDDVKAFFYKHYSPQNAVLCVSGNVDTSYISELAEKWFGKIEPREKYVRNLPKEPVQKEFRKLTVERDVPNDQLVLAYKMVNRLHPDYYVTDLISDILSRGQSSRLYKNLVMENPKFSDINAYISGSVEEGLFIVSGKPAEGVSLDEAFALIQVELKGLITEKIKESELEKVKNKIESTHTFSEMSILNKAMSLCFFELMGDAGLLNEEVNKYRSVTAEQIQRVAANLFKEENCSALYYSALSKDKK
jgi:predicted Zn-dependent peptidase